jgi:NitT/TauT family transport system substrate-binding protein
LKVVNIDAPARVPMLAARKVASVDQFLMSEPAIRRAVTDAKPVCLLLGDYGLEIYSNSIGTSEDYLAKNPDVVKKFVRAALRGWQFALANPEEAAKIQLEHVKALKHDIVVEEIAILKRIAITPKVERSGFGMVTMERMRKTVDFINNNIDVPGREAARGADLPARLPPGAAHPAENSDPCRPIACDRARPRSPPRPSGARQARRP